MTTIWDLGRNDVDACIAYRQEHGGVTSDEARVMVRLQDDPTKLLDEMKAWGPPKPANVGDGS